MKKLQKLGTALLALLVVGRSGQRAEVDARET